MGKRNTMHNMVMREAAVCGRMKPRPLMNARLAWLDRWTLVCGNVIIAKIEPRSLGKWMIDTGCWSLRRTCRSEEAARRAVAKRFGVASLKDNNHG